MKFAQPAARAASRLVGVGSPACIHYNQALSAMVITDANTIRFSTYCCIQDTISSRARLAYRIRMHRPSARASKGILHTTLTVTRVSQNWESSPMCYVCTRRNKLRRVPNHRSFNYKPM